MVVIGLIDLFNVAKSKEKKSIQRFSFMQLDYTTDGRIDGNR